METTSEDSNKETLAQLQNGSQDIFDYIYFQYHKPVLANILKIIKNVGYAEDLLQEVFLTFWEYKDKMRSLDDIPGWLFVVSYNKSITFLNRKLKESSLLLEFSSTVDDTSLIPTQDAFERYDKQLAILNDAVARLPKRKRAVFQQCKIEGQKIDNVADQMGISHETAKNYIKQASKIIRRYIKHNHATELTMLAGILLMTY